MALDFFNMLIDPVMVSLSSFDFNNNFFQLGIIVVIIFGIINAVVHSIIY